MKKNNKVSHSSIQRNDYFFTTKGCFKGVAGCFICITIVCLTTDVDHNLLNYDYGQMFNEECHLFTGGESLRIFRKEDFQWNWGMLSIF